jgi:hypothetical protein
MFNHSPEPIESFIYLQFAGDRVGRWRQDDRKIVDCLRHLLNPLGGSGFPGLKAAEPRGEPLRGSRLGMGGHFFGTKMERVSQALQFPVVVKAGWAAFR